MYCWWENTLEPPFCKPVHVYLSQELLIPSDPELQRVFMQVPEDTIFVAALLVVVRIWKQPS